MKIKEDSVEYKVREEAKVFLKGIVTKYSKHGISDLVAGLIVLDLMDIFAPFFEKYYKK